jgi:hypothetical protein
MSAIKSSPSRPRMSLQPMLMIGRSECTRVAILNATLKFIWSHPFRDITVNSLMASTGLGRFAFYPYSKDLHDVIRNEQLI